MTPPHAHISKFQGSVLFMYTIIEFSDGDRESSIFSHATTTVFVRKRNEEKDERREKEVSASGYNHEYRIGSLEPDLVQFRSDLVFLKTVVRRVLETSRKEEPCQEGLWR